MGHNSAGFHWTFHFHFPLKRLNTNRTIHFVNYCGLWTLMVWHFWQLYAHRWMFLVLLREGTKKISLSAIRCSTTEPQRLNNDRNPLRSSYMTLPRLSPDEKHLSLFLHRAQNLTVSLILFTNMTLLTSLILAVRGTRVIHEFRNGPRSP